MVRVAALWGWLPEFRAVAETESVTAAARRLRVSPSAVSRTIRLLEQELGQPLFERVGRRVELNEAGRHLLHGARSAMRLVDESLALVAGTQLVGPVRVATVEPLSSAFVMPALAELNAQHPELEPQVRSRRTHEIPGALLRGEIDVAFLRTAPEAEQLSVIHLGDASCSIYVGSGHPLFGRRLSADERFDSPFVTLVSEERPAADPWPSSVSRDIRLQVDALHDVVAACASGRYVAVLPDVVVRRPELATVLWRLGGPELSVMPLFAVWRQRLELPGRAEAVVESVRRQFAAPRR